MSSAPEYTECHIHTTEYDEDCEWCDRELTQKTSHLDSLIQKNSKRSQDLTNQGAGVDPSLWLSMKLELLMTVIFRDPRSRANFEIQYHLNIAEALADMESQWSQRKLQASPLDLARMRRR